MKENEFKEDGWTLRCGPPDPEARQPAAGIGMMAKDPMILTMLDPEAKTAKEPSDCQRVARLQVACGTAGMACKRKHARLVLCCL